jgi:hypothetical protein
MPKTRFVWKADNVFNTAFSAYVANVTYHVASRDYGYPAYLEVHGPPLKRLDLGYYAKIEQAKQACEPSSRSPTSRSNWSPLLPTRQ